MARRKRESIPASRASWWRGFEFPVAWAILALAQPLAATTYVLMSDEDLVDSAPIIAEVDILSSFSAYSSERPRTGYLAAVTGVLKGSLESSIIELRVLGGRFADGTTLHLPGTPRFEPGERALLSLVVNGEGHYEILHWQIGTFRRVDTQDGPFALRDFSEATVLPRGTQPHPNLARDYEEFSRWVSDRAAGRLRKATYFRDLASSIPDKYTLIRGLQSGRYFRWFGFDQGRKVVWRFRPAGSGDTVESFKRALRVWNQDEGSNVRYVFAGTTNASAGHSASDGVNAIIFEDPNNDIPGKFDCEKGGILATGGPRSSGTGTYLGRTFNRVVEADIVVQDGMDCFLTGGDRDRRILDLFAHEVGHTLGIGHSSDPNAVMVQGRNTQGVLHEDDRAAVRFLYGSSSGQAASSPNLRAPGNVNAKATSARQGRITWEDNSVAEEVFQVFVKAQKGKWEHWRDGPGDTTSLAFMDFLPGESYKFRIRAKGGDQFSIWSNIALVTMPSEGSDPEPDAGPLEAPRRLRAKVRPETTRRNAKLRWEDTSESESSFDLSIKINASDWQRWRTLPADSVRAVYDAAPGTEYRFRVRSRRGVEVSPWSNTVFLKLPGAGQEKFRGG